MNHGERVPSLTDPTAADGFLGWLQDTQVWVGGVLGGLLEDADARPERLASAMRHPLEGGGKALRPALVRLVCHELGGTDADAARPAAAIELVHSYSLVHDDLPCMDDDDLRRGRPTVHVAFDEATAVLAGDALLTLAFEVLASAPEGAELVRVLARAAGAAGMVGGQVLDLYLEQGDTSSSGNPDGIEAILDMHRRKTAALFGAAAEMGALAARGAGLDKETRSGVRAFGLALGLAFQAVDDLLDVTGDASTLGKTPGKDAALERASLVAAVGFDAARAKAEDLTEAARDALRELGWSAAETGAEPASGAGGRAAALLEFVLARRA